MIDKDTYKKELLRMWDSLRTEYIGNDSCIGVKCGKCPLHENGNGCAGIKSAFEAIATIEKWSKEHPEKKYKISRIEYEVLISENEHLRQTLTLKENVIDNYTFAFSASNILPKLLKFGYYKGANLDTSIDDYLSKSVVVK